MYARLIMSVYLISLQFCLKILELLSPLFKDVFLSHLGLSPLDDGPWPLKVSQRCLGILARVLLARQQNSLHTQSGMDIPECVTVWNRLISTLSDLSLQKEDASSLQGMLTWLLALTVLSPQFYSSW